MIKKYAALVLLVFFLIGCPPYAVTILTPSDGTIFEAGVEITFNGSAMDFKDGELTEDFLVWISDRDGEIGKGKELTKNDLSEGEHNITLTATNSLGETATAKVTITVGEETSTSSTTTITNTTTTVEPDDRLESNCFNWPEEGFSPTNYADLTTALEQGDLAVDFTLNDPSGQIYTLSSLLDTKPVLLVFGAFT